MLKINVWQTNLRSRYILIAPYILFFLLPTLLQAQQTNVDSLADVLSTKKLSNEEQIILCEKLCSEYQKNDIEKLLTYAEKGLQLTIDEKDLARTADFYRYTGIGFDFRGKYDLAKVYYEKGLELAVNSKNTNCETLIYINLAYIHLTKRQFLDSDLSLEYLFKALKIAEETENKQNMVLVLTGIADSYCILTNLERAKYYLEQAYSLADKINYDYGKIKIYYVFSELDYNDASINYSLKMLELSRRYRDKKGEIGSLQNLTYNYCLWKKELDKAENYGTECLQVAKEFQSQSGLIRAYTALSFVYLYQKRYDDCKKSVLSAWNLDSLNIQLSTLTNLAAAYLYSGELDKAHDFFVKYVYSLEAYTGNQFQNKIADTEVKYETQKKEIRIATLEKERKLYIGLGIAVAAVLALGVALLFYLHRLSVQKQKLAEQQIKQLEKENELIAARSALDAEKAEREIIARDLHDGVGAMLSVVKNNMNIMKSYSVIDNKEADYFNKALDGLDKSIVELRRVAHHIMPAILMEKGLYAALDDFCRSIPEAEFRYAEPERRFDPEKELILYRCAYELVNNAMKHAEATKIEVHLNIDETTAYFSVVDNGCGIDLQNVPKGMGIRNLRTRLSAFSGSMDIFSEPGKGTEANVELPI